MKYFFFIAILVSFLLPTATLAVKCTWGQCTKDSECNAIESKATCNTDKKCVSNNNLNLCYPSFGNGAPVSLNMDLNKFIAWLYYFIVGISGFAAFVMITWGGIEWTSSAGSPSKITAATQKIRDALLGLLLVLASFLILQVINPGFTILPNP